MSVLENISDLLISIQGLELFKLYAGTTGKNPFGFHLESQVESQTGPTIRHCTENNFIKSLRLENTFKII